MLKKSQPEQVWNLINQRTEEKARPNRVTVSIPTDVYNQYAILFASVEQGKLVWERGSLSNLMATAMEKAIALKLENDEKAAEFLATLRLNEKAEEVPTLSLKDIE